MAGVSSRTIKREMQIISEILETHGATLHAGPTGYQISINDESEFFPWRKQVLDTRMQAENASQIRQIVCELLSNDYVTQDALAERLYVSRSTVGKLMRSVRLVLDENQIVLSSRPHYGYYLIGKEYTIRNFMVRWLLADQDMTICDEPSLLDRCRNYLEFLRIVTRLLVNDNYEEGDPRTQGLLRYFVVTGARCARGQHVDDEKENAVFDRGPTELARNIGQAITDHFGARMTPGELSYLTSLLGNQKALSGLKGPTPDAGYFEDIVDECIRELRRVYGRDFSDDEVLRRGLVAHLYSTCSLMSIDAELRLPMLAMVKAQYFEAYNYAVMCGQLLFDRYGLRSNEDSLGYIAMHFAAAIERQRACNRFKIVVVSESGRGTSELLRTRLGTSFPQICVSDVLSRAQLPSVDVSDYAFLVSTVPLEQYDVPHVRISPLLDEKDIEKVRNALDYFRDAHEIRDLFTSELFFPHIKAETKAEVFDVIFEKLAGAGILKPGDDKLFLQREQVSSTEINPLVAIPHCIREEGGTYISIFTTTRPIDWKRSDAQLIIAALISRDEGINRRVFPMMYRLTKDESKVRRLVSITDFQDFKDELFYPSFIDESDLSR